MSELRQSPGWAAILADGRRRPAERDRVTGSLAAP